MREEEEEAQEETVVNEDEEIDQEKPTTFDRVNNTGRWTVQEHKRFLEALRIYGKDWVKIVKHVGTRDATHTRSHAQKFISKIIKAQKGLEPPIHDAEFYFNILRKKKKKTHQEGKYE